MIGQGAAEFAIAGQNQVDLIRERTRFPPLLLVAALFGAGIAGGLWQPFTSPWPWLLTAASVLLVGALASCRAPTTFSISTVALAAALLGAAWSAVRTERVEPDNLAGWLGEEQVLVHVDGVALGRSEQRWRLGGSLAEFDYRGPSTVAPIRIDALVTHDGKRVPVSGRAYMRVGETVRPFRAGDRIRATGYLSPIGPPSNPGEFDIAALARALGQAGMLYVPRRDLISVEEADRVQPHESWLRLREGLHRRAGAWLLAQLPDARLSDGQADSMRRDILLRALLLGQREPESGRFSEIAEPFQRLGIAHILAISGLHLGILAGSVLLMLRLCGVSARWQGIAVIAVVLVYLLIVEVRLPVLRAGVMTIAACLGLVLTRGWSAGGLVAVSGVGLLLWRPDQITCAGFQLSFGVVLGLVYLAPLLHRRLWRSPEQWERVYTSAQMVGHWAKAALTVALTSWLVATPILMFHFGFIAPLGVVLSVPAVPLVGLLLALGYLKIVLEILLPSVALLVGVPLAVVADLLIAIVIGIDSLPWTVLYVPFPSAAWTFAALGFVVVVVTWRGERVKRIAALAAMGLVLVIWLYWPHASWRDQPALRLDALSVGHGSCYILRSGGETFVFDAGSLSSLDIGSRTIVPALRRLGVRSIDAIAISHPHLDHYSAVLELVDEFGVDEVLVTHQFIEHAREFPETPVAHVLDQLTQRRVLASPMIKGDERTVGAATMQWLHPPLNLEEFGRDNEHSMVIRIEVAGRSVVLNGDVERQGLASLATGHPDLRACVVELPHHGSFNPLAEAFVTQLEPEVVFQSSNFTQWQRDRWEDALVGVERLVTARDGAVWIEIDQHGEISFGRFLDSRRAAGVR